MQYYKLFSDEMYLTVTLVKNGAHFWPFKTIQYSTGFVSNTFFPIGMLIRFVLACFKSSIGACRYLVCIASVRQLVLCSFNFSLSIGVTLDNHTSATIIVLIDPIKKIKNHRRY